MIEKINYTPNPDEIRILEELTACATWAGRYPIPAKAETLPKERKPEPSIELQHAKMMKRYEKYTSEGKPFADLWDRLHSGIGNENKIIIDRLYEHLLSLIPKDKFR